jgi:hypothetical protein
MRCQRTLNVMIDIRYNYLPHSTSAFFSSWLHQVLCIYAYSLPSILTWQNICNLSVSTVSVWLSYDCKLFPICWLCAKIIYYLNKIFELVGRYWHYYSSWSLTKRSHIQSQVWTAFCSCGMFNLLLLMNKWC